jgi:hypothetical protein
MLLVAVWIVFMRLVFRNSIPSQQQALAEQKRHNDALEKILVSYEAAFPKFRNGGAERDRTADLVNAIHALSQLSYGPGAGKAWLRPAGA